MTNLKKKRIGTAVFWVVLFLYIASSIPVYAAPPFSAWEPPPSNHDDGTKDIPAPVKKKSKFPKKGLLGSSTNPIVINYQETYSDKTWKEKVKNAAENATSSDYKNTLLKKSGSKDYIMIREVGEDKDYTHVYEIRRYSDIYAQGRKTTSSGSSIYKYRDWVITGVDTNGVAIPSSQFKITSTGTTLSTNSIRTTANELYVYFYTPGTYTVETVPYMDVNQSMTKEGRGYHYYSAFEKRFDGIDFSISQASTLKNSVAYSNTTTSNSIEINEAFRQKWTVEVTQDIVVPPGCTTCPPTKIDPSTTPGVIDKEVDIGITE